MLNLTETRVAHPAPKEAGGGVAPKGSTCSSSVIKWSCTSCIGFIVVSFSSVAKKERNALSHSVFVSAAEEAGSRCMPCSYSVSVIGKFALLMCMSKFLFAFWLLESAICPRFTHETGTTRNM